MFKPVQIGGQDVDPPYGGIILDVVQDHGLTDPDQLHGGYRKTTTVSKARLDAWSRLENAGMKRADIARMFGVDKSAVTVALRRAKTSTNECPCCGRPWMPALGRG